MFWNGLNGEHFVCSSIRITIIMIIVINSPTLSRWGSFTSFLPFLNLCGGRLPVPLRAQGQRRPTPHLLLWPSPLQWVERGSPHKAAGKMSGVAEGGGSGTFPSPVCATCLSLGRMHLWCVGSNHPLTHFPTPTGCSSRTWLPGSKSCSLLAYLSYSPSLGHSLDL